MRTRKPTKSAKVSQGACSGVSNFFSSGARLKTAGAPRSEAEGFTEALRAERGRMGEGVTPSGRWGFGGSPPGIFLKIASKWCILVHFEAVNGNFKTENVYEQKIASVYVKTLIIPKSQMLHNRTMT